MHLNGFEVAFCDLELRAALAAHIKAGKAASIINHASSFFIGRIFTLSVFSISPDLDLCLY